MKIFMQKDLGIVFKGLEIGFSFRVTRPTTTVIASTVQVRELILHAIADFVILFEIYNLIINDTNAFGKL